MLPEAPASTALQRLEGLSRGQAEAVLGGLTGAMDSALSLATGLPALASAPARAQVGMLEGRLRQIGRQIEALGQRGALFDLPEGPRRAAGQLLLERSAPLLDALDGLPPPFAKTLGSGVTAARSGLGQLLLGLLPEAAAAQLASAPRLDGALARTLGAPAARSAGATATLEALEATTAALGARFARDLSLGDESKKGKKLGERAASLMEELAFVKRWIEARPASPEGLAHVREILEEAKQLPALLDAYLALKPPAGPRPERDADPAVRKAYAEAEQAFIGGRKEGALSLAQRIREITERFYFAEAELTGLAPALLAPPSPFANDPVAATAAVHASLGAEGRPNVAVGELVIGGEVQTIGPAHSGLDAEGPYSRYAVCLTPQKGQHAGERKYDSEVHLLNALAERLAGDREVSGTFRLYTEKTPCPSCRRVMARFAEDHPNLRLEVYYSTP